MNQYSSDKSNPQERLGSFIKNASAGYLNVAGVMMKLGHRIISTIDINEGRYKILHTDKGKYLVCYKRDRFYSFGKMFASKGEFGRGESINNLDLKYAVASKGVDNLIFIYEDGEILTIDVSTFLIHSHKWVNKENKEVRSIAVHRLKKLDKVNLEKDRDSKNIKSTHSEDLK